MVFAREWLHADSMPKNAMVLLCGDIIVNSVPSLPLSSNGLVEASSAQVRYLQQCEGVRTDVRAMIVPTMTWEWFQQTQLEFLPNVTFPGAPTCS